MGTDPTMGTISDAYQQCANLCTHSTILVAPASASRTSCGLVASIVRTMGNSEC